jgi:hypothetical protein
MYVYVHMCVYVSMYLYARMQLPHTHTHTVGPPALVDCSAISNQWSVFSVSHTYQMAVAEGMAIALQEIHGPDKNQTCTCTCVYVMYG